MGVHTTLREYLGEWAGGDLQKSRVAETVSNLSDAGIEISRIIALGPLAGDMATKRGDHADCDSQKKLDCLNNKILKKELKGSPIELKSSEKGERTMTLNTEAHSMINIDTLDGFSNINT